MTRMTGPDCAVMCNFINTHIHKYTDTLCAPLGSKIKTKCSPDSNTRDRIPFYYNVTPISFDTNFRNPYKYLEVIFTAILVSDAF